MPYAELNEVVLHYTLEGPSQAPVLVFSNSLGTDLHLWEPLVKGFSRDYRVLRYDTRGHGRSGVPEGEYTVPDLGKDVLDLLGYLEIETAGFCGLSIGGITGIWLARYGGSRISKVILCNTAARVGTREGWEDRIRLVREQGLSPLAGGLLERWFTPAFREQEPALMEAITETFLATPPSGYMACCAAIRDMDCYPFLDMIRTPVLVFSGTDDPVTIPAEGRRLAGEIAGAEYCELPGRHLAALENADLFTRTASRFLERKAPRHER